MDHSKKGPLLLPAQCFVGLLSSALLSSLDNVAIRPRQIEKLFRSLPESKKEGCEPWVAPLPIAHLVLYRTGTEMSSTSETANMTPPIRRNIIKHLSQFFLMKREMYSGFFLPLVKTENNSEIVAA